MTGGVVDFQGLYGLPEAVAEIKELKVKNSQKDRYVSE